MRLLFALLFGAALAPAQFLVIRNVTLLDMASAEPRAHATVVVKDGRIAAAGSGVRVPAGARIIDGTGKFLIPGLWDMHVHLWDKEPMWNLYIANGVLGVRDMGSDFQRTRKWREELAARKWTGFQVYSSGSPIQGQTAPGGKLPAACVTTPEQARRAVDMLDTSGVDFVTVLSSVRSDEYESLAQRARLRRIPFAGHVPDDISVRTAIDLRQRSMEHLSGMLLACSPLESRLAKPVLPVESDSSGPAKLPWTGVVWFVTLLVVCYAPVLLRLIKQWNDDEDMGHGFFVPVIAAYIAWQKRDELFGANLKPNYWGFLLLAFAAVQLMIGTLGAELFLARTAFVESVVGAVLVLGGFQAIRILIFPLIVLCFMVPLPAVIYNQITFPLQIFASRVAEQALSLIGIPVLRDGNVLELASQKLSVVEACSGIRSLLSLSFLSLVYGYFFDPKPWMRVVLFISTVPIAIIANAGRVTLTGILSEIKPELAHGFMHTASGWVIFMIALAILILWHQILNRFDKVMHGKSQA